MYNVNAFSDDTTVVLKKKATYAFAITICLPDDLPFIGTKSDSGKWSVFDINGLGKKKEAKPRHVQFMETVVSLRKQEENTLLTEIS